MQRDRATYASIQFEKWQKHCICKLPPGGLYAVSKYRQYVLSFCHKAGIISIPKTALALLRRAINRQAEHSQQ